MKFNFEDLKLYQKSLDVIDSVYVISQGFPKEEIYGLTSQFRRVSISIALNIWRDLEEQKKNLRLFAYRFKFLERKYCLYYSSEKTDFLSEDDHTEMRNRLIEVSKNDFRIKEVPGQRKMVQVCLFLFENVLLFECSNRNMTVSL